MPRMQPDIPKSGPALRNALKNIKVKAPCLLDWHELADENPYLQRI